MTTLTKVTPQTSHLFDLAQQYFDELKQECAAHGIRINTATRLHPTTGFLSYYDLQEKQIYLSLPDHVSSVTKLQQILARSLYGFQSNEEHYNLIRLLLPHTIAHELAHALRHDYGLFSHHLWHEEQLANQLGTIALRHYRSQAEQQQLLSLLAQVIAHLSTKFNQQDAINTYRNFWQGLRIHKQISDRLWQQLQLHPQLFNLEPTELFLRGFEMSDEIIARLEKRTAGINQINAQYAANQLQYIYYQVNWMYLDLKNSESFDIEDFAQQHLNLSSILQSA
ncbi:hypothetical protein Nos7524_1832 [Nostoc sp. PCC 7524]|uniref:hypothetical protein n=1 Tax=Nostoc sp. (strain ATCC 29411 / PCC 7524) TaxID=28072 RepID=UPI00029ED238|nr:hypothetical protein [Nostoc sp. PCC 7524]AFY47695.1 hypothetical protein Nos7524_1832 [Nostoc sp. PCC 7524]